MMLNKMLQYFSAALMRHRDDYYWGPGGPGPRSGVGNPFPTPLLPSPGPSSGVGNPKFKCRGKGFIGNTMAEKPRYVYAEGRGL